MTENVETRLNHVYRPSDASLALRARIARVASPLRPVTPKVPFWRLAAHRIPTLWTLYRGLLRTAPTPDIKWKINQQFRKNMHLTSPRHTKRVLEKGHKWLDVFEKAKRGDEHWKLVVERYGRMLAIRRDKIQFAKHLREYLAEQEELRKRPIVTGAYFRATLFNNPLPRLKPQPMHISAMIHKRRLQRAKRQVRLENINEMQRDLVYEATFEKELEQATDTEFKTDIRDWIRHWREPLRATQRIMSESFQREYRRSMTPFPPKLIEQLKAARREKIANKTRERERERRGEILACTVKRANKGPPPHVLVHMSPLRRHLDRVSRSSVSEVGYIGMVKKRLGWKLKDPDAWKVEIGKDEDQPRLEAFEQEVRKENLKRRQREESKVA